MELREHTKKFWVGIDPGSTGSMTIIYLLDDESQYLEVYRFSKMTEKDIIDVFLEVRKLSETVASHAILEKVHSTPQMGVKSAFTFGDSFGFIRSCLWIATIPFDIPTPRTWIKTYNMKRGKDESKTDWKVRLKQRAQQLFPKEKITLDMADSMLIANYCKNQFP